MLGSPVNYIFTEPTDESKLSWRLDELCVLYMQKQCGIDF